MRYHSVCIFVADIEASRRFYTEVLDGRIEHDFGANIILAGGISIWQIDPGHLPGLTLGHDAGSPRFELYFETEDIGREEERLTAHGVAFLHGVREEPWGQRTIRFFDPDGHLIEIGESLATFLCRMLDGGMTEEQIANKTSIPREDVRGLLAGGSR